MEFKFSINNDRLMPEECIIGVSGNVNTYICSFDIKCDYTGLTWFCVFKQGDNVYSVPILNNECVIPYDVLENSGRVYIGVYGTNEDKENIRRVSTNWLLLRIDKGAYSEGSVPDVPTADAWEVYVNSKVEPLLDEIETAESQRQTAENNRLSAENNRNIAESNRQTAEDDRATAESERATAETQRLNAEANRNSNETERILAETARVEAESARAEAEAQRALSESERQSDETERALAESARVEAETERVSAESARAEAEASRADELAAKANTVDVNAALDQKADTAYIDKLIPKGEASGNPVTLTDHLEGVPLIDYKVYGNSVQATRSGKNLIDIQRRTLLNGPIQEITGIDSGEYCFLFKTYNNTASVTARIYVYNVDGVASYLSVSSISSSKSNGGIAACNFTYDKDLYPRIYIACYCSESNVEADSFMLVSGTYTANTLPEYEAYGVMPSPGYPSEIQSVGDLVTDEADEHYGKYRISISCEQKNLVNISGRTVVDNWASSNTSKRILTGNQIIQGYAASNYVHKSNVTISEVTDESISIISKSNAYGVGLDVEICPNTEYYLSGASGGIGRIMVGLYDKDGYFLKTVTATDNFTFTTPNGAQWAVIALTATANIEGSVGSQIKFYDIQLERGSNKTEYELGGNTERLYIYTDEPLRKVGDYADYVDFEKQRIVRLIEVLDDTNTKTIEESYGLLETPVYEAIEVPSITVPESSIAYISVDTGIKGDMEVKYYQDINKKLAELQTAVTALGGV